jgi:3-hydroxyacyl-[acyl-carrier-protein] dehydratase
MRVLWVDRLLELRFAERVVTALELPADDPIFAHHFPLRPVLPASVLLEAFAQAATILLETSHAFRRKAIPGYFTAAKFRRAIRPGARLVIEMLVEQWSPEGAVLRGRADQDGAPCASCTLGMYTAPIEEFYGAEHLPPYRAMYERWLTGAVVEGFEPHPLESLSHAIAG